MLGILIGIAAVILTVGLGLGAAGRGRATRSSALGSNLLIVSPGSTTSTTGVRGGFGSASTLTAGDAAGAGVTGRRAGHRGGRAGDVRLAVADRRARPTGPRPSSARRPTGCRCGPGPCPDGRFLTAADDAAAAHRSSCSAPTTATELFGGRRPGRADGDHRRHAVHRDRRARRGRRPTDHANDDDQAVVPDDARRSRAVFGGTSRTSVSTIYVQARSQATLSAAYQEAQRRCCPLHGITDGDGRLHDHQPAVAARARRRRSTAP